MRLLHWELALPVAAECGGALYVAGVTGPDRPIPNTLHA